MRRKTRRVLEVENNMLKQDAVTVGALLKAYMRKCERQEDEIAALNASLDCTAAELERWKEIAHKADERRVEYVRRMVSRG